MMMKNKIILLLVSVFLTTTIFAQPCGTTFEMQGPIVERLTQNKEALRTQNLQQRDVQYLPVRFHVIRNSDGTAGVSELNVFQQMCQLNEIYNEFGIVFYLKPINYIDNSDIYTNHFANTFFMNGHKDLAAINIYVAQDANTDGGGQGQTLAYYSTTNHWIVVRVDKVGGNQKTLSHELGHFFSLPHTFLGWDGEAYDESVHGNPVGNNSPYGIPNECQDGSNCETAGDMICDTPPDYNFGFGWSGCNYTPQIEDPCGDVVDPDEENIMGYFLDCQTIFSPMQKDIILADLVSAFQGNINLPYIPGHAEITETPTLETPVNNSTTDAYNAVLFEWTPVAGANYYFLEIAETPNFNMSVGRYTIIVYGTAKWISGFFTPEKNYWWRVKALNEVSSCTSVTPKNKFKTGAGIVNGIVDIENTVDWSVGPNPVRNTGGIRINVVSKDSFDSKIKLYDLKGSLLIESKMNTFNIGETNHFLYLNKQSTGIYILTIDTPEGRLSKKVFITT